MAQVVQRDAAVVRRTTTGSPRVLAWVPFRVRMRLRAGLRARALKIPTRLTWQPHRARAQTPQWLSPAIIAGRLSHLCGDGTNMATTSATHAVSSIHSVDGKPRRPQRLTGSGLYHKLHGVHRPSTMKKSVIKRRKRVIPASQELGAEGSAPAEPIQSPSPPRDISSERGSMNPDGSISLGMRKQQQEQQGLQLVPESVLRQNSLPPMTTAGNLTQYSVYNKYHSETPQSLDDEHRLAPITSLSGTSDRQSSLSPASFLSPTRKRSFGETNDSASPSEPDNSNNKRLSSIKSILNPPPASAPRPASPHMTGIEEPVPQRACVESPAGTMVSAPSPGAYSNASSTGAGPAYGHAESRRLSMESETSKAERRAALQREAQRMRQMLAENEKELAELEN